MDDTDPEKLVSQTEDISTGLRLSKCKKPQKSVGNDIYSKQCLTWTEISKGSWLPLNLVIIKKPAFQKKEVIRREPRYLD